MGAVIKSTEFTDDNVLFSSRGSANSWRLSMTVDSMSTSAEGVAKQCAHVGDITTIDGVDLSSTIAGSNADDQTAIATISGTYSEAEIKAALQVLAEKINHLTYQLEQAGLMKNS